MSRYLGPAGIFGTDSPVSDQMQIEAEQGPWDEDYLYEEEEYPEEATLYGCCPKCFWWDWAIYAVDDPHDLKWARKELERRHQAERPECSGQLDFG